MIIKIIHCGDLFGWCLVGMLRVLGKVLRLRVRKAGLVELSDHLLRDIGYEPGCGRHAIENRIRRDSP